MTFVGWRKCGSCLNFCLWQFLLNIEQTNKNCHHEALGSDVSIDWVEMVVNCVRNHYKSKTLNQSLALLLLSMTKNQMDKNGTESKEHIANKTVWNNHMHPFQKKSFGRTSNGNKSEICLLWSTWWMDWRSCSKEVIKKRKEKQQTNDKRQKWKLNLFSYTEMNGS